MPRAVPAFSQNWSVLMPARIASTKRLSNRNSRSSACCCCSDLAFQFHVTKVVPRIQNLNHEHFTANDRTQTGDRIKILIDQFADNLIDIGAQYPFNDEANSFLLPMYAYVLHADPVSRLRSRKLIA